MRKFTIAGLAIALALALSLDTPRPVAAATGTAACLTKVRAEYGKVPGLHEIFLLMAEKVCEKSGNFNLAKLIVVDPVKFPTLLQRSKLGMQSVYELAKANRPKTAAEKEFNARFDNPQGIKEPGLMGMAGTLLREDARAEAWVVWNEKRSPPLSTEAVTAYQERYVTIIDDHPELLLGVKVQLYRALRRIAGPAGAVTPGEKEFLEKMVNYVRDQNIKVAQGALVAYDAWLAGPGSKPRTGVGLAALIDYGQVPPDFHKLAANAIMGSALALGMAGTLGAVGAGVLVVTTTAIIPVGTVITPAFAATSTSAMVPAVVTTSSTSTGMGALMGGSGGVASTGVTVAAIAGPVAIALVALAIGGIAIYEMVKINEARPKLEEALTKAKLQPDLGRLMNAPKTAALIQYYFAKATSDYSPTGPKDTSTGCQACFYEANNYGGKSFCTAGRENDLKKRIVSVLRTRKDLYGEKEIEEDFHWGDKISSVSLDNAKCKDSFVNLYEHDRMRGKTTKVIRSIPDLSRKVRGKGNWNDKASSLEFKNSGAPQCEICLFSDREYEGGFFCAQGPVPDLRPHRWSDRASSVYVRKRDCPKAKLWLYEHEDFKGKSISLTQQHSDFKKLRGGTSGGRKEWDDDVTSLYFAPDGTNPYWGRQVGGCRVCLYEDTNYEGRWVCVNGDKDNAKLKDKGIDINDQATSIDVRTEDCPAGQTPVATLYQHQNFKGSQLFMEESDINFGRLKRGSKNWNDTVSSVKVEMMDLNCRVCLYGAFNYGGKKHCTTGDIKNLKDVSFNDIASSIKLFRKSCLGAGVTVYEHKNFGGNSLEVRLGKEDIPSLGTFWNDRISSLTFNPTAKAVVNSSLPKAAGPNMWKSSSYEALDISAGPDGLVWIIGTNNVPKIWDGKRWSIRGSRKGTRIDAGPRGTAWMVGTNKYLYTWKSGAWQKVGTKRATDVGVGADGTVWIVSGDSGDKKSRPFGSVSKNPDHYKVYRWDGRKWIQGGQSTYAMRIDVDPRGNAWIVDRATGSSRFLPKGPRPSPMPTEFGRGATDISIGANGKVVMASDAPWVLKGKKWDRVHGLGYLAISVDRNGDLWGIATRDTNEKYYPGLKKRINFYANALLNVAIPARAPAPAPVKKWQRTAGTARDISAGPDGAVWAIGADKRTLAWTGKGWDKRGAKKGTRIDAGPNGTAWMVGTDKYAYSWSGTAWSRKGNKTVSDVGVGADGSVWAVGTNPVVPLKWTNNDRWRRKPSNDRAIRIDVGPKGQPWIVDRQGKVSAWFERRGVWSEIIYHASYADRRKQPGTPLPANDISIGADGTVMIAAQGGGTAVWTGEFWEKGGPGVVSVNVALTNYDAAPWATTANNQIWAFGNVSRATPPAPRAMAGKTAAKKWKTFPGTALDISAGPGGSLWVIGPTGTPWTFTGKRTRAFSSPDPRRKMMTAAGWEERPGPPSRRIDIGPGGWVWVVGIDGYAYHWRSNKWNKVSGKITDIAIGANGKAWAIGADKQAGGHSVYRLTTKWTKVPGVTGVRIDVGPKGNPWVVNDKGQVFTITGKGWEPTAAVAMAAAARIRRPPPAPVAANDISVGAGGQVWIALKGGGTAIWTGVGWAPGGLRAKSANVAVGQKGAPWATTDKQQIYALK